MSGGLLESHDPQSAGPQEQLSTPPIDWAGRTAPQHTALASLYFFIGIKRTLRTLCYLYVVPSPFYIYFVDTIWYGHNYVFWTVLKF